MRFSSALVSAVPAPQRSSTVRPRVGVDAADDALPGTGWASLQVRCWPGRVASLLATASDPHGELARLAGRPLEWFEGRIHALAISGPQVMPTFAEGQTRVTLTDLHGNEATFFATSHRPYPEKGVVVTLAEGVSRTDADAFRTRAAHWLEANLGEPAGVFDC